MHLIRFFSIQISMNVQVTHATTMARVITISENGIALVQLVGLSLTAVQVRYLILKLVEEWQVLYGHCLTPSRTLLKIQNTFVNQHTLLRDCINFLLVDISKILLLCCFRYQWMRRLSLSQWTLCWQTCWIWVFLSSRL